MTVAKDTYREEANELLTELESSLLDLETTPADADLIGRIFRALHTIKGSGSMFGFDRVARFTHDVENAFDLVRDGKLSVSKPLIELSLAARDRIKALIDNDDADTDDEGARRAAEITESLKALAQIATGVAPAPGQGIAAEATSSSPSASTRTYRIRFTPAREIFKNGTNPILLLKELASMGPCTTVAQTAGIPPLDALDPETCYTRWDLVLTTDQTVDAIRDVFIFVQDECDLTVNVIADGDLDDQTAHRRLGEILVERGDLSPADLAEVLQKKKRIGEVLVESGLVKPDAVRAALAEQEHIQDVREKRPKAEAGSSLRVAAEKLDRLVNLVGELVTVQARLSQLSDTHAVPELEAIAEVVERLTNELRDTAMSIRMMPIGSTFSQFQRLVRDLSRDTQKQIVLTTEGAETELDKTVIERLTDPLMHLIRNSVDHGIELPEARKAAGKSEQGTIQLSAMHSGGHVLIRISDDGAGIDAQAVRAKAIERGVIAHDAALTDADTYKLIFAAGFSTAKEVTSLSGRGVGMDVVKRTIEALRGSVEIESHRHVGSTITLKLPLTLAIIDGLLVSVGDGFFVLPLSAVEECVELVGGSERRHGKRLANVRGEIVPYIRLREQFMTQGAAPDIEQIVIAKVNGQRIGFVVDRVVGQHQTVIKSLGRFYRDVDVIAGATILGDGTPALILDPPKLVRQGELEEYRLQH